LFLTNSNVSKPNSSTSKSIREQVWRWLRNHPSFEYLSFSLRCFVVFFVCPKCKLPLRSWTSPIWVGLRTLKVGCVKYVWNIFWFFLAWKEKFFDYFLKVFWFFKWYENNKFCVFFFPPSFAWLLLYEYKWKFCGLLVLCVAWASSNFNLYIEHKATYRLVVFNSF